MNGVMGTLIGETLQKAAKLDAAAAWFDAITPELKRKIVNEYIQKDQLTRQGVDETGTILGYYAPLTELLTRGRKKAGTPYDLNDTGDFYRSMFVTALNDGILIEGDTEKMEGEKWFIDNNLEPDKILGLTDENLQKVINEVRRNYIKYAAKILGIN